MVSRSTSTWAWEWECGRPLFYVDARARFKANPRAEVERAGLTDHECEALLTIDWIGLEMTARSFAGKQEAKQGQRGACKLARAFWALFRARMVSRGS